MPDKVWDFHNALYVNQPREGTEGLSDVQIADIATGVGVPADVADTFTEGTYRDWAAPGDLAKAVEAAAAAGGN